MLTPQLVDLDGMPVPPATTLSVTIGSSPLDGALEETVEHCLPQAQDFTQIEITLWETQLELDSAYSVQLHDAGHPPNRIGFSAGLLTSRFAKFSDHVTHASGLFNGAPQLPVLDSTTAATTLSAAIDAVINGTAPGYDDAVEAVYRRLLGVRYSRLSYLYGDTASDFGTYMVGSANGQKQIWGIALELNEPLVGKDGVGIDNIVPNVGRAGEGVVITNLGGQNRLILRDHSGSRLLIFNSADGFTFNLIQTSTRLGLRFSGEGPVRASVQEYVDLTFLHYTTVERTAAVDKVLNQMQTMTALNKVLAVITGSVTIPVV